MARTASGPPSAPGTIIVPPRSDTTGAVPDNNPQPDVTGGSAAVTASPKRGRGRPSKSDSKRNDAVSAQSSKKPSGRPKRNQDPAAPTVSVAAAAVKNTRGRAKRSNTVPVRAAQVTSTADGSRKRGRPKKDDVATATVAPVKKRGRKPTTEVTAAKLVRTTRKTSSVAPVASNLGDLKKRTALLQKKVKEAAAKLKVAVTAIEEVQKLAAGM